QDQTAEPWPDCVGISLSNAWEQKLPPCGRFPAAFHPVTGKMDPDRPKMPVFSGTSGEIEMSKARFSIAAVLLAAATLAPSLADARHYRHHHRHHWPLPYQISYLHNYGPGSQPGTFAYYDGP